jgi:MFS family permease
MARVTPAPPPKRRFLGWDTVVGGAGLQLVQSALFFQSFGVYVVTWTDELGWSRGAISAGFALITLLSGTLGPFHGMLLERFGVRRVIVFGLVVLAAGLSLLSGVTTLTGFYVAMLLSGLGLSTSGFLSITTAVVPWFVRRRSTALALMSIGISLGGLLVPLIAGAVVEIGWRTTMQLSAGIVLLAGLPLAVLMRRDPSAYGQRPDGDGPARGAGDRHASPRPARESRSDHTLAEALRTRAFWLIGIGHASALLVVSAVTVHLVAHVSEGLGFSLQRAATAVALVTLTSAVGQVIGGPLGDRFDKRLLAGLAMIAHGGALLVLAWVPSWSAVVTFATLHGLAWGVRGPLMGSLRADYFGASHFGSIMGASMMVFMVGQLIGPVLAGTLADLLGDYRLGFTVLASVAVLASLSFWLAAPPPAPQRPGVGASAPNARSDTPDQEHA